MLLPAPRRCWHMPCTSHGTGAMRRCFVSSLSSATGATHVEEYPEGFHPLSN